MLLAANGLPQPSPLPISYNIIYIRSTLWIIYFKVILILISEALCPFLQKIYEWRSMKFGIVKVYTEKCKKLKTIKNGLISTAVRPLGCLIMCQILVFIICVKLFVHTVRHEVHL